MKTRILTGLIFALVLLGAILWNIGSWTSLMFIVAILGLHELYKMAGIKTWSPLSILGYMSAFAVIIGKVDVTVVLLVTFLAGAMVSLRNHEQYHIEKLALYMLGLYYIVVGFNTGVVWYQSLGKGFILYLVMLIWVSDSGAYFVGYFFGKHPMSPLLSPKKTYEGLFGGVVATVIISIFLSQWLQIHISIVQSVATGLFVSIVAPIGDLFESSIKRYYKAKDSGTIFPGHGGILDRFDSFLFVMIAYQLFYLFF